MTGDPKRKDVDRFIIEHIDTVPHLEALLLLWTARPQSCRIDEIAQALYTGDGNARALLQDFARKDLIEILPDLPERYVYRGRSSEADALLTALEHVYRRDLIRISRLIHSKTRDSAEAGRQSS